MSKLGDISIICSNVEEKYRAIEYLERVTGEKRGPFWDTYHTSLVVRFHHDSIQTAQTPLGKEYKFSQIPLISLDYNLEVALKGPDPTLNEFSIRNIPQDKLKTLLELGQKYGFSAGYKNDTTSFTRCNTPNLQFWRHDKDSIGVGEKRKVMYSLSTVNPPTTIVEYSQLDFMELISWLNSPVVPDKPTVVMVNICDKNKYVAEITKDTIKVGCQTFQASVLNELRSKLNNSKIPF